MPRMRIARFGEVTLAREETIALRHAANVTRASHCRLRRGITHARHTSINLKRHTKAIGHISGHWLIISVIILYIVDFFIYYVTAIYYIISHTYATYILLSSFHIIITYHYYFFIIMSSSFLFIHIIFSFLY